MEFKHLHYAIDPDPDAAIISGILFDACKTTGMIREVLKQLLQETLEQSDNPINFENALVDEIVIANDVLRSKREIDLVNPATECDLYSDVLLAFRDIQVEKQSS